MSTLPRAAPLAVEDEGGLGGTREGPEDARMLPTDIDRMCQERGWTRARLIHEMRSAATVLGETLPAEDSLRRMLREWASGRRRVSAMYADVLSAAFALPVVNEDQAQDVDGGRADLEERLTVAAAIDSGLVEVFRAQTRALRQVDRRLGASRAFMQTEAHVEQLSQLLRFSTAGASRDALAVAVAEAASLAAWQALDLGRTERSWSLYETAKSAARESEDCALISHSTAEQGYALIELGKPAEALLQMRYARERAQKSAPALVISWLWSAEAEVLARIGDEKEARRALDRAERALDASTGEEIPYLSLDSRHFARWRGHCLAQLGAQEAVAELEIAVGSHDSTFVRAASGLHADLALAYLRSGQADAAEPHVERARTLAGATASVRHRNRLRDLSKSLAS